MEVRLKMDGGVASAAPPGKKVESPPPDKSVFKEHLSKAENESKIGEVAESEPNAPLQNLDSEIQKGSTQPADLIVGLALVGLPNSVFVPVPTPMDADNSTAPAQNISETQAVPNDALLAVSNFVPVEQLHALNVQEVYITAEASDPLGVPSSQTTQPPAVNTQSVALGEEVPVSASLPTRPQDLSKESELNTSISAQSESGEVRTTEVSNGSNFSSDQQDAESPDTEQQETGEHQSSPSYSDSSSNTRKVSETTQLSVKEASTLTTFERAKIASKIADKIEALNAGSMRHEIRVRMEPEALGTVLVSLKRNLDGVTASLSASNDSLRENLHESRRDLAMALEMKGLSQVKIEVSSSESTTLNQQAPKEDQSSRQSHERHREMMQNPSAGTNRATTDFRSVNSMEVHNRRVKARSSSLYLEI